MTDYRRPGSLDEALRLRSDLPDYLVIAGATDVMVGAATKPPPLGMIDIFELRELNGIHRNNGCLEIGSATTYASLQRNALAQEYVPALVSCSREIGAAQIQARGTIGGNIITSSPVGDTLPVLLALEASVVVASTRGQRVLPYDTFCTGYRKTQLASDELLISIQLPLLKDGRQQRWQKVGTRRAQAISKVMAAACLGQNERGEINHCRIAMGAVADRPIRLNEVETLVLGHLPTTDLAEEIRATVARIITPIDDVRSNADYRMLVAQNIAARFVLDLNLKLMIARRTHSALALLTVLSLAACTQQSIQRDRISDPSGANERTLVYVARHAEKGPRGRNPALTAKGRRRAKALRDMLLEAGITTIFASELKRTQQTVTPLAKALDIEVTVHPSKQSHSLAKRILREHQGQSVLVAGHTYSIPSLLKALGLRQAIHLSTADYGDLFVLSIPPNAPPTLRRQKFGP